MASILSFGLDHGGISAILCIGGGKLHRPQHFLDLIMARSLLDLDRTFLDWVLTRLLYLNLIQTDFCYLFNRYQIYSF